MNTEKQQCRFCEYKLLEINTNFQYGYKICKCPNCGIYKIYEAAFEDIESEIKKDTKYQISGAIRELNEKNYDFGILNIENYKTILQYVKIPKKPIDKINKIINYIYKNTEYLYQSVEFNTGFTSISYSKHKDENENLIKALKDLNYIDTEYEDDDLTNNYYLTLQGYEYAENQNKTIESKQCFVALWFSKDMIDIFNRTIKRAIEDSGYSALIIPMKEYNDDITDNIIAEIRKSKFIIADYTGNRGGVYYEAGFAEGLGKNVIMTCHKDWFDKEKKIKIKAFDNKDKLIEDDLFIFEKRKIHFDINHRNIIIWDTENELYTRLLNRINATII